MCFRFLCLKSKIMKTLFTNSKFFPPKKTSAVNICILSFLFFIMLLLGSCQKNMNDVPANQTSSNESDLQLKQYDAAVATDWYEMQLRFLLEKNSVLANGGFFGYIGIG